LYQWEIEPERAGGPVGGVDGDEDFRGGLVAGHDDGLSGLHGLLDQGDGVVLPLLRAVPVNFDFRFDGAGSGVEQNDPGHGGVAEFKRGAGNHFHGFVQVLRLDDSNAHFVQAVGGGKRGA
jgi:hypothetical protein